MPLPEPTAENVVAYRKSAGLSQSELCRLLGVKSVRWLSKVETAYEGAQMSQPLFELMLFKTNQHPDFECVPRQTTP
ncbi:helix-turn-helix domain-containing protein [Azohydromonas lata]|uniref:helix-turn-helix domain-containing protein n=1 Tax=Azohydromonas lata TaxID=45677 RepID=UPI0012F50024|nr:helix-turn-helix transcriptional regulator [Azohydromonas lata]